MLRRLIAIAFLFSGASIAWMILGNTIVDRTHTSDEKLRGRVQSLWGSAQTQAAPFAECNEAAPDHSKNLILSPAGSDIEVQLSSEPRRKGLLWYATYKVAFLGRYEFRNDFEHPATFHLSLRLPAAQAVYDDLQFIVNGHAVTPIVTGDTAYVPVTMQPNQGLHLQVGYRSQGLDTWKYSFGENVNAVRNFHLRMATDFQDIDFPDNTLAPTEKINLNGGWRLDWNYRNLLSGYSIAMAMPQRIQPGPLASEISFFAPVSLFFFLFLMFIIATLRDIDLHPMNYFFLCGAFFAFHLLLAYLVDHVDVHVSFVISAVVSVLLVVTYLRLVVGVRFALREAALAQFLYLVLFSYAFFFQGFTGLAITIGAIITLFAAMQMTGRIRWSEKFSISPSTAD
ncbi:MAG TPA: inner membrane CreD family protein [Bryobacteraceae bacterium]|jgi:hypothetical protein|nr:inner membrane CreD family protein [Bryobacteraceae bacterium]